MRVRPVLGGLAEQDVDLLVRVVARGLAGRGSSEELLRAAGPDVAAASRRLTRRVGEPPVLTGAGDLRVRWLLHLTGPPYDPRRDNCYELSAAYRAVLAAADEVGARSLALPGLGTVPPYWPLEQATRVGLGTLFGAATKVREVRLVLSSPAGLESFTEALARR